MDPQTPLPELLLRVRDAARREPAGAGTLHLHLFALPALARLADTLQGMLSPDERERAHRYPSHEVGAGFVGGRGMLRWLLSAYLGRPARELAIETSPGGRPLLAGGGLDFNVSHTREHLAIAVASPGPVGVDVERTDELADVLSLARRFFAPEEYARLLALPDAARKRAFVRAWTQKEAYLKARGLGLASPLSGFQVAVLPDEPCGLIVGDPSDEDPARWRFFELAWVPGAHVALAVAEPEARLRVWSWLPSTGG